jgi:UDP-N-acetylglucosamine--N-acetylmuramyl-(pentapeptide) pyrophosphoryl-undecaprenol N-acetylglucosamine transferase
VTLLFAPLHLLRAVFNARAVMRRVRPRSVLSMGGFAAGPGGIAAWLASTPMVVHEQNSVAGITNKVLARLAQRVLGGFAGALPREEWVGNPVREAIVAVAAPRERMLDREGPLRLLVLGGSQGAASLNTIVPELLRRRGTSLAVSVLHQCGARHLDKARQLYLAANVEAEVVPFIDDMANAYAWADLAICRAGALTLAELAAAGVASILVPFPAAVDDHQTHNAQPMVAAGAARLVAEGDDFVKRLGATLTEIGTRARLLPMAEAARGLAKPDATRRIADACIEVAP